MVKCPTDVQKEEAICVTLVEGTGIIFPHCLCRLLKNKNTAWQKKKHSGFAKLCFYQIKHSVPSLLFNSDLVNEV